MTVDLLPDATTEDRARVQRLMDSVGEELAPDPIVEPMYEPLVHDDLIGKIPFGEATLRLVNPWAKQIRELAANSADVFDAAALSKELTGSLLSGAQQYLLRSQIDLMQKRSEHLKGESSESRYKSFDQWLAGAEGTECYIRDYPASVVSAQKHAEGLTEQVDEILARYRMDRDLLSRSGILPNASITSIQIGRGDTHHGRSVAVLSFQDGMKLIYKPRSLRLAAAYWELIQSMRERWPQKTLIAPRTVDRGEYGWSEFIDSVPGKDASCAYRAMGELLGIMHVLRANDMHYENIVMRGDTPVPVDLETLLASIPPRGAADKSPGPVAVSQGVSVIGLLPASLSTPGKHLNGGISDISPVGYSPGEPAPFSTLVLHDAFTDQMHFNLEFLARTEPALIPQMHPEDQQAHIVEGYRELMTTVLDNKAWFRSRLKDLFQQGTVRFVALDTQRYAQALRLATHPDLQKNTLLRHLALCRVALFRPEVPDDVILSELRQLQRGDIPMLTLDVADTSVFDNEGVVVSDVLENTPLQHVLNCLDGLSKSEIQRNVWLIRLSFAPKLAQDTHGTGFRFGEEEKNNSHGVSVPQQIRTELDLLKTTAVPGTRLASPTWIGGRSSDTAFQYWIIDDLGADLYMGSGGNAYNTYFGGRALNDAELTDLATSYFEKTLTALSAGDTLRHGVQRGAQAGIESLFWAAYEVGSVSNNQLLTSASIRLWTRSVADMDGLGRDVTFGLSGLLLALCSQAPNDRTGVLRELAELVALRLVRASTKAIDDRAHKYSGFAHGLAGEQAALARWFLYSGDQGALATIRRLLDVENQFRQEDGSIRLGDQGTVEGRGWCNGAPGLLLSKSILVNAVPELYAELQEDILRLKKVVAAECFGGNITLCHGDSGNLLVMADSAMLTRDTDLESKVNAASQRYTESVLPRELAGFNRHTIAQSMMAGSGGALLYLIRAMDPSVKAPLWFGA